MAQVSPLSDGGAAPDDAGLNLAGTLACLPQEWKALRNRNLDEDVVDAVLVHPDLGVALVSLAPVAPEAAAARLRERFNDEHFGDFFPGALPIVVLGTTPPDVPESSLGLVPLSCERPSSQSPTAIGPMRWPRCCWRRAIWK